MKEDKPEREISLHSFILSVALILSTISIFSYSSSVQFLPEGPSRVLAEGARNMWDHLTLESQRYRPLFDELLKTSKEEGSIIWQDVFSLTSYGQLIPGHCPYYSLLSAPAYGVFGDFGFWLLNNTLIILSALAFFVLLKRYLGRPPSSLVLTVSALLPLPLWSYSFGFDTFGVFLIMVGMASLASHPYWEVFLTSASLFIRPTNILFLGCLIFEPKSESRRKSLMGATFGLILWFLSNRFLWGSAFRTSRERMPRFINGAVEFYFPTFNSDILLTDWLSKLLSPYHGLLVYSPLLFFIPFSLYALRGHKFFHIFLAWNFLFLINAVLIFSFDCWNCTSVGNRYLMPWIQIISVPILIFLEGKIASVNHTGVACEK